MSVRSDIQMAGPSITDHEVKTVADCMANGWFNYDYVERFEREFAAYHGRRFGLMTPNCTSAIHLLLLGLGVGAADEVILPECTWIASAAPVTYQGARTVLCDIEEDSWCMDPRALERAITKNTKAFIAVDLFGNMPRMTELEAIARDRGIFFIEDAAEAVGSTYRGRRAGSFGVGSVFSFHRTKTICTGEGGMLLLDDLDLFERCQLLRDHGRGPKTKPYFNEAITPKYMPFNLQAAMGLAQFQRIEELVGMKRHMFHKYRERLGHLPGIHLNAEPPHATNGAWITGLVFGRELGIDKPTAIARLAELGVPARPFFYPLSSIPAYAGREEQGRLDSPVAYDVSARGINLPCSFTLTDDQLDFICDGVERLVQG